MVPPGYPAENSQANCQRTIKSLHQKTTAANTIQLVGQGTDRIVAMRVQHLQLIDHSRGG